MIPSYQGTCGVTRRAWARQHPDRWVRYLRAYAEATRWCFERRHRLACLNILARHNEIGAPQKRRSTRSSIRSQEHSYRPERRASSENS